jgi:hypothetical protein
MELEEFSREKSMCACEAFLKLKEFSTEESVQTFFKEKAVALP